MLFPPARDPALDPALVSADDLGMRSPLRQVAAIVAIATTVAWLSPYWQPGPWNAVIWIVPSLAIAIGANKGVARLLLAPLLLLTFPAAMLANEVAAHFVFGTCLQD